MYMPLCYLLFPGDMRSVNLVFKLIWPIFSLTPFCFIFELVLFVIYGFYGFYSFYGFYGLCEKVILLCPWNNMTYIVATNPRWSPFCSIYEMILFYHLDNMCDLLFIGNYGQPINYLCLLDNLIIFIRYESKMAVAQLMNKLFLNIWYWKNDLVLNLLGRQN